MSDIAGERPSAGPVLRVGALLVLMAAVAVGSWQVGRIVGPLDPPVDAAGHGMMVMAP